MAEHSAAVSPAPESRAKSQSSSQSKRSIPARMGSLPEAEISWFPAVTTTGRPSVPDFSSARRSSEKLSTDQSSGFAGVVVCKRIRSGFDFMGSSSLSHGLGELRNFGLRPALRFGFDRPVGLGDEHVDRGN